jgi:hypothetical protein
MCAAIFNGTFGEPRCYVQRNTERAVRFRGRVKETDNGAIRDV